MAATAKKLHWTQRPENREKLANVGRMRHGKPPLIMEDKPVNGLLDEWSELQERTIKRVEEIKAEIDRLQNEMNRLNSRLGLDSRPPHYMDHGVKDID